MQDTNKTETICLQPEFPTWISRKKIHNTYSTKNYRYFLSIHSTLLQQNMTESYLFITWGQQHIKPRIEHAILCQALWIEARPTAQQGTHGLQSWQLQFWVWPVINILTWRWVTKWPAKTTTPSSKQSEKTATHISLQECQTRFHWYQQKTISLSYFYVCKLWVIK